MNSSPSPKNGQEETRNQRLGGGASTSSSRSASSSSCTSSCRWLAATELKNVNPVFGEQIVFNVVDGVIRIALFLLFIWGVSLWRDIRRVYQYHGAEHKTVFAFENRRSAGADRTCRNIRRSIRVAAPAS